MLRALFILVTIFILSSLYHSLLVYFRFSHLKKKIKANPLIGVKQEDSTYDYKEKGFTVSYKLNESSSGIRRVDCLSCKRRLTFFEEKVLHIKRKLNNFFIYRKWFILFHPLVVTVLVVSLVIFYFLIKEHSFRRIEHFKYIIAKISGIKPEAIVYVGQGQFKIFAKRQYMHKEVKPVTIRLNPLKWFFFSDTAEVSVWSSNANRYINYPISISKQDDVWLEKKGGQIHGKVQPDKIIWDKPAGSMKAYGHHFVIEDGKLKFIDE